jgi:hypothetical protein
MIKMCCATVAGVLNDVLAQQPAFFDHMLGLKLQGVKDEPSGSGLQVIRVLDLMTRMGLLYPIQVELGQSAILRKGLPGILIEL